MRFTVIVAAALFPNGLELPDNLIDSICQEAWKSEIAKSLKEIDLLYGELKILWQFFSSELVRSD